MWGKDACYRSESKRGRGFTLGHDPGLGCDSGRRVCKIEPSLNYSLNDAPPENIASLAVEKIAASMVGALRQAHRAGVLRRGWLLSVNPIHLASKVTQEWRLFSDAHTANTCGLLLDFGDYFGGVVEMRLRVHATRKRQPY